ncbi:MAG: AzlC family ABC transporter permease [Clostridia bacterium]|nr:AzlC family ABC transporter permease [Clostridia bacterium]
MSAFVRGMKKGIPIGVGYLSVSFTFGIMAIAYGFDWWQAVIISMTTLTSAGQLAGIGIMVIPGQYIEMLISQLTINLRYSFMSVSLSQKTSSEFRGIKRWLLGFFMTDEIFAVASDEEEVTSVFFVGLSIMPFLGWTFGTLLGSLLGNILPSAIMNALCLAIYGMFVAIVAPRARSSKAILTVVLFAAALHSLFYYLPFLKTVSSGIAISISAIVSAVFGAVAFPIREQEDGV